MLLPALALQNLPASPQPPGPGQAPGPFLLYGLNLPASSGPRPPGPGAYPGPFLLLYGLNLAPPTHPDLVAAVVARLREWNGGAIAAALGEATGVKKIWSDEVMGSPQLPWVRVNEPISVREYSSEFNYIESGQIQVDLFTDSRLSARQVGWMMAGNTGSGVGALDDPPLAFDEGSLMFFRLRRQFFAPTEGTGVGTPKTYHRVLLFDFKFSGQP